MTVLYILDPGVQGGAMKAFIEVLNEEISRGVHAIVCNSTRNQFNEYLDRRCIENYSIHHAPFIEPVSPYKWKRPIKYPIRKLNYFIKRYVAIRNIEKNIDLLKVDLIHTNSARNDIGCFINKKYGIPHIMHIREFADADFNCIILNSNYIKILNSYSSVFISVSNAVRDHWISKGILKSKSRTLYDGVHYEDILLSDEIEMFNEKLKMVITGGICEAKGQLLAVKAIEKLPNNIKKHISLDIIGWDDPLYKKKIQNFILEKNLVNKINFVGELDSVHDVLKNYQIGLTCSRAEGFGRVTAEYMFAGMGLIVSDSGANTELVKEDEGLAFKNGDSNSLADCIEKYFLDRSLLLSCARKARQHALLNFTSQRNANEIMDLYNVFLKF